MSAFSECEYDTTPWLKAKKEDPHFLLFQTATPASLIQFPV